MNHNSSFSLLFFLILTSTALAQISMPLTKYFFAQPNSTTTDPNNAFLTDPGSIAIDTVDNSYYNVHVKIGSQQEEFSLVIDTAAFFTFVTIASTSEHHFDCNSSSTCVLSHTLLPIWSEGGTEIQGSLIDDNIYLNDTAHVDQRMIIVTNNNISFLQFPGDGQLGLQQRPTVIGISVGMDTVLENLQSKGVIPSKSFGIYISNATNDNSSSELMLGGYNTSHMAVPDFTYYPLASNDAWKIGLSSVSFGNITLPATLLTAATLTFDTRCSAIVASRVDFDVLLAAAQAIDSSCGSQSYGEGTFIRCNCTNDPNDYTKFPTLGFAFIGNDTRYSIYAGQYVFHDTDGNCVLGIAQAGELNDEWAIGHSFMKNYYTYYDQDNNQIGIAPAKPNK